MPVIRRGAPLTILVVLGLFLLFQIYERAFKQPHYYSTTHGYYDTPPKVEDGRFGWAKVAIRYPVTSFTALPTGTPLKLPQIQHEFAAETAEEKTQRLERRQDVKDSFERCWRSYRERAWMKDELAPISGGFHTTFGGWAATLVDALDSLWIMDMRSDFQEAVEAAEAIDFTTSTDKTIIVFETTIRYLGGFLAAYDLSGERGLLDKAIEVGEMLYVAFDTPNRMPVTRWDWSSAAQGKKQVAFDTSLMSEIGSLSVEFTRLSQLTGDSRWYDAIQRITSLFAQQQDSTKLPGMWPVAVDARNNDFTKDTFFSLGGMSDSTYEYFPKEYVLLGGVEPVYRKLYEKSMATAVQYNFFRPMTPMNENILFSGNIRARSTADRVLDPQVQHLTCFTGGMLALGSKLFDIPQHLAIARKLVDGCVWAYRTMPQGIMPETFHLVACDDPGSCPWNATRWEMEVLQRAKRDGSKSAEQVIMDKRLPPGFTDIGDARYILRPEAIESLFILYRITGDKSLPNAAWTMYSAIKRLTETEYGNAALVDITVSTDPQKSDRMESFWLAETLKYFYLIFSEPELISLDEYVFNTEAHPFKRPT